MQKTLSLNHYAVEAVGEGSPLCDIADKLDGPIPVEARPMDNAPFGRKIFLK